MKSKSFYFMPVAVLLLSTSIMYAGDRKTCNTHDPGEDIYKHYTGTIGTKKVTFDLRFGFCGGSNYGGSYICDFEAKSVKCLIINAPQSSNHNARLSGMEVDVEEELGLTKSGPTWNFRIKGDSVVGKWESEDRKHVYDIKLTEDYTRSYKLDILVHSDTVSVGNPRGLPYIGVYNFIGLKPAASLGKADAEFINSQLVQMTSLGQVHAKGIAEFPAAQAKQKFGEFKATVEKLTESDERRLSNRGDSKKNYYNTLLFPVCNENGMLVMESDQYELALFGIHTKHSYSCIDVTNKRVWRIGDILTMNRAILTKLLQDEYRTSQEGNVEKQMAADKIVPTEDVLITHAGLIFCVPAINTKFATESRIFVPYDKLAALLTKDFKTRMGLK